MGAIRSPHATSCIRFDERRSVGLQVGDAVAIEPGVPCSCNKHTREGRYNLDPDIKFFATPPHHGSLAQVCTTPAPAVPPAPVSSLQLVAVM